MSDKKKLSSQSGLELNSSIPSLILEDFNGEYLTLNSYKKPTILIFVSLYCEHCVDLLPYIGLFKEQYNMVLFSNGDKEDHQEMNEYFQWQFPLISMNINEMKEIFKVEFLPFVNIYNAEGILISKGVVYKESDLKFLIESVQL